MPVDNTSWERHLEDMLCRWQPCGSKVFNTNIVGSNPPTNDSSSKCRIQSLCARPSGMIVQLMTFVWNYKWIFHFNIRRCSERKLSLRASGDITVYKIRSYTSWSDVRVQSIFLWRESKSFQIGQSLHPYMAALDPFRFLSTMRVSFGLEFFRHCLSFSRFLGKVFAQLRWYSASGLMFCLLKSLLECNNSFPWISAVLVEEEYGTENYGMMDPYTSHMVHGTIASRFQAVRWTSQLGFARWKSTVAWVPFTELVVLRDFKQSGPQHLLW